MTRVERLPQSGLSPFATDREGTIVFSGPRKSELLLPTVQKLGEVNIASETPNRFQWRQIRLGVHFAFYFSKLLF